MISHEHIDLYCITDQPFRSKWDYISRNSQLYIRLLRKRRVFYWLENIERTAQKWIQKWHVQNLSNNKTNWLQSIIVCWGLQSKLEGLPLFTIPFLLEFRFDVAYMIIYHTFKVTWLWLNWNLNNFFASGAMRTDT